MEAKNGTSPVDVTVSIVNWNTRDFLRRCLESVLAQDDQISFEIHVVDNASADGSAEMVRSLFGDRVRLISMPRNVGFAAAQNESMRLASGRYVFLLNPDSVLGSTDVLRKMVEFMDANPDVGLLGPKVLNPDGSLQYSARRFPTMLAASFRHTLLGRLFPNNAFVRRYLMTDWPHDRIADVDWLSGSALLARVEMIRQIGMLDERFYMYLEDVDWCRRAHEAGWRVVYFPEVTVIHKIGGASDQNPVEMIKEHHRSMLRYFLKYNARSPRILLLPLVLLGLWLRTKARLRLLDQGKSRNH
ncbi:MAG: glycosyltransferase family 2 protein [Armatimonadota bacterium]|nr:glycosyltransferase family 2 protein [Armatimonadota bacterium]